MNITDPSLLSGCHINEIFFFLFTDRKPSVKISCYRILNDVGESLIDVTSEIGSMGNLQIPCLGG